MDWTVCIKSIEAGVDTLLSEIKDNTHSTDEGRTVVLCDTAWHFTVKLQLLNLLCLTDFAKVQFEGNKVSHRFVYSETEADYNRYREQIRSCRDSIASINPGDFVCRCDEDDNFGTLAERLLVLLFPNGADEANEADGADTAERAKQIRQSLDLLAADKCADLCVWLDAVRRGLDSLSDELREMAELSYKRLADWQYETYWQSLQVLYCQPHCHVYKEDLKKFQTWKENCMDNPENTCRAFLGKQLKELLDSDFLSVDESNFDLTRYKEQTALLAFYIGEAEITDTRLRRFAILQRLVGMGGCRFHFNEAVLLGKHLIDKRGAERFTPECKSAGERLFWQFKNYCTLVYTEYGDAVDKAWKANHTAAADSTNAAADKLQNKTYKAGRKQKELFADEKVKKRCSGILKNYLIEHHLGSRELKSTFKKDTLNQTVLCFIRYWNGDELLNSGYSAGSVYRFLTQDCELKSSVDERSWVNKWLEWSGKGFKEKSEYLKAVDMDIRTNVEEFWNKQKNCRS